MSKFIVASIILFQCTSFASGSASSSFDFLKALKGKWAIQFEGKPIPVEMTYDEGSKNSIVTEQFGKELSVFYIDGDDLLMTHFCNIGNQPRLKLKPNTLSNLIEFETFDITNVKDESSPHVKKIIYKIIDNKNFDLEIVWKKGAILESEKYSLTKK
ncbi:MAG: hypothetical protein ACAH59_13780 [Pseudobdellovibrionaceae bacterium]